MLSTVGLSLVWALLLVWITCMTSGVGGVSVGVRCPANMTLRHDERWTSCAFPHILTNQRGCGRPRNETWDFRLCDPNYMLSYMDGWEMEEYIRDAEETTPYTCDNIREDAQNYTFAMAIVNSIAVPDLSSPDVCINGCGAILPKLKGRNPTEEEINTAMEQLAISIRRQWALGVCENDIVFLYSREYQVIHTVVGSRAASSLTPSKLASINNGAVDFYFRQGDLTSGIRYLVSTYKHSLLGFSPAHVLILINMLLILFTILCLIFVMNLGQEINVLHDESVVTKCLKWFLYVISMLWAIQLCLWFLGWVGEKPKSRTAYIFLPVMICLVCVLVTWIASPNVLRQIHDQISKQ